MVLKFGLSPAFCAIVFIKVLSLFTTTGASLKLTSLARRDFFYLDAFWRVNLGMYVIINNYPAKSRGISSDT